MKLEGINKRKLKEKKELKIGEWILEGENLKESKIIYRNEEKDKGEEISKKYWRKRVFGCTIKYGKRKKNKSKRI